MSKAKTLKRGDAWTTKDRLWAVIWSRFDGVVVSDCHASIFTTRQRAKDFLNDVLDGEGKIVRLSDVHGVVQ